MTWSTVCESPAETKALGCRLGSLLRPGDAVLVYGDLGAGKTVLAQGIAAGLGADRARSPSFALLHRYQGMVPVYHADLYRLHSREELAALDLSETAADGVLVVEWPELAEQDFPDGLAVRLSRLPGREETRRVELRANGEHYEGILRELKSHADLGP
ncbi:MAG: tRNA (adenosine(37)-N6)-threonylcarbamoyltransferase complex ATPase subunit type 1 TsaE [Bacteroidota bacterium]